MKAELPSVGAQTVLRFVSRRPLCLLSADLTLLTEATGDCLALPDMLHQTSNPLAHLNVGVVATGLRLWVVRMAKTRGWDRWVSLDEGLRPEEKCLCYFYSPVCSLRTQL